MSNYLGHASRPDQTERILLVVLVCQLFNVNSTQGKPILELCRFDSGQVAMRDGRGAVAGIK